MEHTRGGKDGEPREAAKKDKASRTRLNFLKLDKEANKIGVHTRVLRKAGEVGQKN